MAWFGKKKRRAEFKRFEKAFKRVWRGKKRARAAEKDRNALLTPELINVYRRNRQNLVLDYGRKGVTVTYTPKQLDKFAKETEKKEKGFKTKESGVPVPQLLSASLSDDIRRAKKDIRTAVLYRMKNNTLYFRVTASGKSKHFNHYQVRVRLEDWDRMIRKHGVDTYYLSAKKAAMGNVSFDCTCGRHQYWFRYLATIGGFALDPYEHVFPKIKNPGLRGCCCKHVIKTLAVLQTSIVLLQVEKAMAEHAKKKGWVSRLLGSRQKSIYSGDDAINAMDAPGEPSAKDIEAAFRKFGSAKKGFAEKMTDKALQKKVNELGVQNQAMTQVAKDEFTKRKKAERGQLIAELNVHIMAQKYEHKKSRGEALKSFSKDRDIPIKEIQQLAEEANL
jgi:sRNA-binding regulator protein Hfq